MAGIMKPSRRASVRAAKYSGKNTVSIAADMSDFNAMLAELGDDIEEAIRPAAQAGSEVLYQAVRRNVQGLGSKSGNLLASIYQAYSEDKSGKGRATYHVSWRTSGGGARAPHGHLLENGWIQRYAVHEVGGKFYTLVRPEMRGKPRPNRRAPQAVKDAYYVPRKGGPIQHPARSFIRKAQAQFPAALQAAEDKFFELVLKV